ncbi:hypothetical protein [Candidatus Cyanaurora vandensis]|uniref:hypothetical protein n=1 Tax=Candidatus Cyanaurora vandensis TaxID=2714958 RepID=UPI002580F689|nr:hypothetical protein [Candidatus Cyanaurora vandensis]
MENKEFKWENERYNQTREQNDGLACGGLDVGIAYGLMMFAGLSFILAVVLTVSYLILLF